MNAGDHDTLRQHPEESSTMAGVIQRVREEGVQRGMEQGMQRGMEHGRVEGERAVLERLLRRRPVIAKRGIGDRHHTGISDSESLECA